jgi:hypothetical protein
MSHSHFAVSRASNHVYLNLCWLKLAGCRLVAVTHRPMVFPSLEDCTEKRMHALSGRTCTGLITGSTILPLSYMITCMQWGRFMNQRASRHCLAQPEASHLLQRACSLPRWLAATANQAPAQPQDSLPAECTRPRRLDRACPCPPPPPSRAQTPRAELQQLHC